MMLKKNKDKRNYYIHYDIARLPVDKLNRKGIGKVQYKITIKYFVYHGNAITDSDRIARKSVIVSGNQVFKRVNAMDENIRNTKRTMVGELKRDGVDEQTMTLIMAKKGFGHDAR